MTIQAADGACAALTIAAAEPGVATPAPGSFRVLRGLSTEWRNSTKTPENQGFSAESRGFVRSGQFPLEVRCSIHLCYGRLRVV